MAAIRREDILTDGALKAPLEMAANFDKLAQSILKVVESGKSANVVIEGAKSVKELSNETKNLADRQKELNKINKQIETQQAKNNDEYVKAQSELKKLKGEYKKLLEEEEKLIGTEEKILKQNKELREERKKLNVETSEGASRLKEINDQLDENTEKLKSLNDQMGKQRMNVGNYRGSLEDLFMTLKEASESEGGIKKLFVSFAQGAKAATQASLKFIATPIGAILTAIIGAFYAFNTVMNTNTETGVKLQKIWGGLKDVFNTIISRIVKLATAFVQLVTLDFAGAAETASSAFSNLAESLEDAYNRGVKFVELQKQLEKVSSENIKTIAELEAELNKYNQIAGDATISLNKQNEAALKAAKTQIELTERLKEEAKLKTQIAKIELDRAKEAGNSTEAQRAYNEALAEESRIMGEYQVALLENNTLRRQILQDNKELELDFLIDHLDNTKTINEKIIANEQASLNVRQEMLNQLTDLADKSFSDQIRLFESFTKKQIDLTKLLEEQDPLKVYQYINQELGLSEILTTRLLEVIRERKILLRDLLDLQIQLTGQAEKLSNIPLVQPFDKEEFDENTKKSIDELKKRLDKEAKIREDAYKKMVDDRNKLEQELRSAAEQTFYMSTGLIHSFAEQKISSLEEENQAEQSSLDAQIEAAEGNEERQQALRDKKEQRERETQREISKIRRRQALLDKAIAIGNITVDTARAIAKAVALSPITSGLPWSAIAGAIGAAQTAIVLATPIPQFEKGTDNAPEGLAIVNEKGRELMITPSGEMQMIDTDKPTLTYLQKGTIVVPTKETKALTNGVINGIKVDKGNYAQNGNFAVLQELMKLNSTIKNKKEVHMNFDRHAVEFWTKKGEVWTRIRNQDYA